MFAIFFFKQKTAYELRISDWSSDVCSSDLHPGQYARQQQRRGPPLAARWGEQRGVGRHQLSRTAAEAAEESGDRKSVVRGTRVSERVDLGGRGISKKKRCDGKDVSSSFRQHPSRTHS